MFLVALDGSERLLNRLFTILIYLFSLLLLLVMQGAVNGTTPLISIL